MGTSLKSLHIKSDNNRLYAVIHSPSENCKTIRSHAVVICSPIAHEHTASYWAVRQLANRLSKLGFDVVRFDYFATGNSTGLSQQLTLKTCAQNIVDVAQFLLKKSDCEKVSLIGLRLGAMLASMSAKSLSPDQLILWDPVIDGERLLTQLATMHKNYLDKMYRTGPHQHTLGQEYLGYPYSDNLLAELNQVQLDKVELPVDTSLSILSSPNNEEQKQFIEKISDTRSNFQNEILTEGAINWQDIGVLESSFLPGQSINQICNLLKTER